MKYLFLAFLLASCATAPLSREVNMVRVTSTDSVVGGCKFIGEVKGSDHLNGGVLGQSTAEENALKEIKQHAFDMGANTVKTLSIVTNNSGSTIRGESYRC